MNAVNEHKKFGMAIEKWRVLNACGICCFGGRRFFCAACSAARWQYLYLPWAIF